MFARMALSKIRRMINFMLALALMAAGGAGVLFLLLVADRFKGWMLVGAGFACGLGVIWLYSDFIDATPNEEKRP